MLDRSPRRIVGTPPMYAYRLCIYPEMMKRGMTQGGDLAVDALIDNGHSWSELVAQDEDKERTMGDKFAVQYKSTWTGLPVCREVSMPYAGCLLALDAALGKQQTRLMLRCCIRHKGEMVFVPPLLRPDDVPLIEALTKTILKDSWPLDKRGEQDLKCEIAAGMARDAVRDGRGVVEHFDRRHKVPNLVKRLAGLVVLCHAEVEDPSPRRALKAVLMVDSPKGGAVRLAEYCPRNRVYPFLMSHRGIPLVATVSKTPVLHHRNPALTLYIAEADYFVGR